MKPLKEERDREAFWDTPINVTIEGHEHLGAALGSISYANESISEKVETWVSEVTKLAELALSQPKACYAAYTFGLKHRWTYFLRTLPDTQDLQESLEKAISDVLIPAITKQAFNQNDRNIISFLPRHGGLRITNPCTEPCLEYSSSIKVTAPLVEKIVSQSHELPEENDVRSVKQEALRDREEVAKDQLRNFKDTLPKKSSRALDLAAEKGASTWLTVIPLK